MHIAVLAKVVPDYAVPAGDFELAGSRAHSRYTRMMGLYDENAIETGVQLKEKSSASLTVISYGSEDDVQFLRKAAAMGADRLVIVTGKSDDAAVIAANLKAAIDKLGDVDIVLAGQQSADMDRGIVHGLVAGMLGCTFIPQVSSIAAEKDGWKVLQNTETGTRELKFSGKAVLSVTSVPQNVPRIPAVRAIFAAKKKPVDKMPGIEAKAMAVEEISVQIPKMESVCEFISAEDVQESVKTLLTRLREERYL